MATANKIFVSPGVYTSERDLSFVAQSVGVTTLGIVGETLTGPAFEPIFITNYDEFQAYFGGTVPEKFVNTQIPKYEAAYIAKSYLQQSNQLFVTRVLGLSGYDAGPSWSLTTIANVDPSTISLDSSTTFSVDFSGTTGSSTSVTFLESFPSAIEDVLTDSYTQYDGSTTTINTQLQSEIYSVIKNNALSATTIYYFGSIDDTDYATENSTYTASTNVYGVDAIPETSNTFSASTNDPWYYSLFNIDSGDDYVGSSFYTVVSDLVNLGSGNFSGTVSGTVYTWAATAYTEYNDIVVATLRSRGIATYTDDDGAVYQVTGSTNVGIDSSGTYGNMVKNPYTAFRITGTTIDSTNFAFVTSMQSSDANYVSKVFGISNFGKSRTDVPVFVEERYQSLLNYAFNKGYIRGLNTSLIYLPDARQGTDQTTIANYLTQYQASQSPWVVSELRGSTVYRLFKAITIADGNTANQLIKVSIANISFANGTFDLVVRDFYDTDANPVIIEKYTSCSMDPTQNNYVGKKVGSSDGEYALLSRYIMLELNNEAPVDALPCGFEGFTMRTYSGAKVPFPVYKTSYYFPGEVIYNPPFGTTSGGDNSVISSGDNKRRVYLGISDTVGIDPDYYLFKGYQLDTNLCQISSEIQWNYQTKGFHMDSGATAVTINSVYSTSGTPAFECGVASFDSEPTNPTSPYYTLNSRKFTFLCQGGFDGWDIYREYRTNGDRYVLGQTGYLKGACSSTRYPTATGWGAFRPLTVQDNSTDYANTDYYAYLLGVQTFSNPEAVNINVLVTPGIDYVNNSNLVESTIDMVENDRADSIYICTTPDYNMFVPTASALQDFIYPQEAVDNLENTGIDSNYTATYYPWVLTRDNVNNTQIYIPATAEVTRNLALTDNIAFPWFATAGYTRGIVNAIKARKKLTQTDRDTLYQGRINPIATFSDVGTVIWGNKTLQIRESALDRINVRRLLLQARKLISAVAVRLLFEQNDGKVRQDFLDAVNPILDSIRRDRGLYDFRVTVSATPEDLDNNQMTGKIYLKPTKALEFIDIEFLITPTGASFENI